MNADPPKEKVSRFPREREPALFGPEAPNQGEHSIPNLVSTEGARKIPTFEELVMAYLLDD